MAKKRGRVNRIDNNFIDRHIRNQYALDIETTGSSTESGGVLQIGIVAPDKTAYELNIQQQNYKPSKFHARKGGLDDYYKSAQINPEVATNFKQTTEEGKRKYSAVLSRERAKLISKNLINRRSNSAANLIIHNANFEIKHFNKLYDGLSPISFSQEYKDLVYANAAARSQDLVLFNAGRISALEYRSRDIQRQKAVYELMMEEAAKGGAIIDTMEIAKTANALAQEKGLVKATGDLALGTNLELLAETFLHHSELHRSTEDAGDAQDVAPYLVELVEKLKKPNFNAKMLTAEEAAWVDVFNKDHLKLKVQAQTKAIKQAIDNLDAGRVHRFHSGKASTDDLGEFINYLGRTGDYAPAQVSQGIRLVDHGMEPSEIVSRAIKNLPDDYRQTFDRLMSGTKTTTGAAKSSLAPKLVLGAAAGLAFLGIAKKLSEGSKEDHNTIEGLRHGYFGAQRKDKSDFGSGYKGAQSMVESNNPIELHNKKQSEQESSLIYPAVFGAAGLYAAYKGSHYLTSNTAVNSLSYLGPVPAGFKSWAEVLGRENATYGDLIFNATKRFERSFGGFPKAFSASSLMSPTVFRDTNFKIDLTTVDSAAQERYLSKLTGKELLGSGIAEVEFKNGKLLVSRGSGAGDVLLENARLYENIHDPNIVKGSSKFTKAYANTFGVSGIGKSQPFLVGGAQTGFGASLRELHAYAVETAQKYFRLMDDPVKAARDLIPDVSPVFAKNLEKFTKYIPKMGVGGEVHMAGTLPQLLLRHAKVALPVMIGVPAALGTLNWAVKQLAPDDTVAEKAGLTGIAAEGGRLAHMTYAKMSDMTGLTSLRKYAEEQAPGMTGVLPFLGVTLSFGFTGMALGAASGLAEEAFSANRYATMLKNKSAIHKMPEIFSNIKGFNGEYTLAGKYGRIGAVVGAALAAPMLLAGLGSSKSAGELDQEYLGGKEVAVKKGRWWEFGMTPFEGGNTMYYRPNWYNRILNQPKSESLYGDDEPSPIGKFFRSMKDPYWEEKAHYYDRPYPVASASGEDLGMFGTLYERTVGQIIKPTAYMHTGGQGETLPASGEGGDSALGMSSQSGDLAYPAGLKSDIRQQAYSISEAMGLRGFTSASLKEAFTGSQYFFEDEPVLQSSSDMNSTRRDLYDLNLGGGFGTTEAYRRMIPNRPYTFEYVNEIPNTMPSWMPGENYYKNFKVGDPFTKVPEGEYRLPGAGYATRFKELEGVNPEDYPLIHRYKILADIAMDSTEYRSAEKTLQKSNLSDYEKRIFEETQAQVAEKRKKRQFNYDEDYTGVFGTYAKGIASLAQLNPIDQLTPFAPGHKFLPTTDPLTQYEESIFGKSFKMWQRPVDDFIKPFLYTTGNLVGISVIPPEIQEARSIEKYFDEIKYVKFKKLEQQAQETWSPGETSRYAHNMLRMTRLGTDPYAENLNEFVLPKREREFLEAFKGMNLEDKSKVLELAPEDVKDIYQGQFDLDLEKQIKSGEMKLTESDRDEALAAIDSRRSEARARKRERQEEVMSSPDLPDENWEGWQASVDLEDVKMKYLMNEGKDFHYYNLWDDRARRIKNRPDVAMAAQSIDPTNELRSGGGLSRADMIKLAHASGIKDPRVNYSGAQKGVTVDTEYDSEKEEDIIVRELGYTI